MIGTCNSHICALDQRGVHLPAREVEVVAGSIQVDRNQEISAEPLLLMVRLPLDQLHSFFWPLGRVRRFGKTIPQVFFAE